MEIIYTCTAGSQASHLLGLAGHHALLTNLDLKQAALLMLVGENEGRESTRGIFFFYPFLEKSLDTV